jgi:hypothetical protein
MSNALSLEEAGLQGQLPEEGLREVGLQVRCHEEYYLKVLARYVTLVE